jgi:hypothetical protein
VHAWQVPPAHRSDAVLHVPLSRQVHPSPPRAHTVHVPPTHSPAEQSGVAEQLPPSPALCAGLQAGSSTSRSAAAFHPVDVDRMRVTIVAPQNCVKSV